MTRPAIGFIGLGLMGSAMAGRLQSLGYPLTVLANRSRTNVDKAVAAGATEAATAKELAEASDIVMLCVDTSASVESRIYGEEGVLAGVRPDAVVIDFGTSLPGSTKAIGAALAERGAHYMDAPLGRTPAQAVEGKLNIMAAGDPALYARVKPVLDDLGENVFHVGPLGAGHALKLINNFYSMISVCALSEAFAAADHAGVPRDTLYEVMNAGPNGSGMMGFVHGYATKGDIHLAFAVKNGLKDIGYYAKMTEDMGLPSQMSHAPKNALALAAAQGWGEKMVPQMVDYFSALFGDAPPAEKDS